MPSYPCTISEFKSYFARDFNFAPANDQGNINEYIVDADVSRAIAEAQINFNDTLFESTTLGQIFMYLVAYTLVTNLQNSAKGISSQAKFPISSNNVGGVSITFALPDRYAKDAFLQQYTKNGYGMKYLELVLPYLVAVATTGFRRTSSV